LITRLYFDTLSKRAVIDHGDKSVKFKIAYFVHPEDEPVFTEHSGDTDTLEAFDVDKHMELVHDNERDWIVREFL
jgi:hypothetical protein